MRIPMGRPSAVACVSGGREAPCLCGTVKFYQVEKAVLVVADICGLPASDIDIFALHIHEGSTCGENISATGNHFNPDGKPHPSHAGDLPPLFACGGKAYLAVLTNRFCLRDIIGRTVVIHSGADDFRSQPAGNAGSKIGCGVITPWR